MRRYSPNFTGDCKRQAEMTCLPKGITNLPWMPDDTIVIGDLNRLRVGPLQSNAVSLRDVAKTGEAIEAYIYGDYTMEVRNATEAFSMHTGLTS